MKKFFLDKTTNRILSPLLVGTLFYMLILTIYNDIFILLESFISKELLVCIGLAIIAQEVTLFIYKIKPSSNRFSSNIIKFPVTILIVGGLTSLTSIAVTFAGLTLYPLGCLLVKARVASQNLTSK